MTTELQPKLWSEEPVRDAAHLLRRIAFFLLFGAAPALSPYSKRSLMLFASIGASLLLIAAVIEGQLVSRRALNFSLPLIILLVSGFVYLFWSGLSLAWTPFPGESGGRYASFVSIILAAMIVLAVMPTRVSASRLYILSAGVTIGFIICLGSSFAPFEDVDHVVVDRSLTTLSLLVSPVTVWLIYRRRDVLALVLIAVACLTAGFSGNFDVLAALLSALLIFGLSLLRPDQTRYYLAVTLGCVLLFSPLIPLIFAFPIRALLAEDSGIAQLFTDWFRMIADDPFRLLTGHGFDTIGRAAAAAMIPPDAPRGLLIDTWFELGLVGALALSALATSLVMLSSLLTRPTAAAMQAVIVCAFIIGTFGGNLSQTPWLMSIALAAIAVVALERGQYKTARPRSDDIAALNQKKRGFSFFPDWLRF